MTDSILNQDNLNLSSIVTKLNYGKNTFLFMGDAEVENEKTISWPKVDVLKVGHHGSNTSTSERFLSQVSPEIGIIMVGENNKYNLPSKTIINRLEEHNVEILRTDKNGVIELTSDGNKITKNTWQVTIIKLKYNRMKKYIKKHIDIYFIRTLKI